MTAPFLRLTREFVFLTLIIFTFGGEAEGRLWTDRKGYAEEADLVKFDGKNATVRLKDGTEVTFGIDQLSDADQKFLLKSYVPEKPKPAPEEEGGYFNWDDPWPRTAEVKDVEITVEKEDVETKKFIYTSNHFRFICDVRLTGSVVSTFAKMFEASHEFCRVIPLTFRREVISDEKFDVRLFETKAGYVKAGGPPASAGVFISGRGKNYVMVPLVSLGVQKFGSGYRRDREKDDSTLVHEIVHQLSPACYFQPGARGWFSEGIAEYISNTPYRSGRFRIANNFDEVTDYFSAFGKDGRGGRNLGEEFTAPALKNFMTMPYGEFVANANFNYGLGLALVTYFIHLEGEGDAALLKKFLAKLHEKKRIRSPQDQKEVLDILLNGRTWEELQDDISKGWRRKGIKISFRESRTQ